MLHNLIGKRRRVTGNVLRQNVPQFVAVMAAAVLLIAPPDPASAGETKYQSADEAYGVGAAFYNARNYAAAREPFEAALKLAPDDKYRVKVYRALLASYRQLPEIDKMLEAAEFIVAHSDQAAARSLVTRDLLSFVHQRGKTGELIARHEERLKKDPNDKTSLFILIELHSGIGPNRNPKRGAELIERLAVLEKESGKPADVQTSAKLAQQYVASGKLKEGAELFEQIAPQDAGLAAWHWKEAANAWLKARENDKALAAAKKAAEAGPEKRSELLAYFWHNDLGNIFLATGEPKLAVPQYEQALAKTKIQGYIDATQKKLEEARAKSADK